MMNRHAEIDATDENALQLSWRARLQSLVIREKNTSKRNNEISESSIGKPLGLLANNRNPMICQFFRIFSRTCLLLRKCNFFSFLLLSFSMAFRQLKSRKLESSRFRLQSPYDFSLNVKRARLTH